MLLVIMSAFKGQYSDDLRELCVRNNCEIVIVPQNLTNNFQPLDVGVNKAIKAYVSKKYNVWMANETSKKLKKGIAPPDVKSSIKLSVIKPLSVK